MENAGKIDLFGPIFDLQFLFLGRLANSLSLKNTIHQNISKSAIPCRDLHLPSCVIIPGVVGDSGLLTSLLSSILDLLLSDSERVILTPPDVTVSPAGLRAAGSSPDDKYKHYNFLCKV